MEFCTDPNALKLINVVLKVIDVLKVAIIVILIIMGMIDFFKSVFSKDADENKKLSMLFIKRLISAALVFLLPAILELVIDIIGGMNTKIDLADCVRNVDNIAYFEELAKAKEQNKVVVNESKENATIKENEVPGGTDEGTFIAQKYEDLTELQIYHLAYIAKSEQGSLEGASAEASLMANVFEDKDLDAYSKDGNGLYKYVIYGGWFAHSEDKIQKAGNTLSNEVKEKYSEYMNVIRKVLVEGKRTMPPYVVEHDCWDCSTYNPSKKHCADGKRGDICSITNGDNEMTDMKDIKNRENYIKDVTRIKTRYQDSWEYYIFYSFPKKNSDPFGYTPAAKKKYDKLNNG